MEGRETCAHESHGLVHLGHEREQPRHMRACACARCIPSIFAALTLYMYHTCVAALFGAPALSLALPANLARGRNLEGKA